MLQQKNVSVSGFALFHQESTTVQSAAERGGRGRQRHLTDQMYHFMLLA